MKGNHEVLRKKDYLADNSIHRKRKLYEITGNEHFQHSDHDVGGVSQVRLWLEMPDILPNSETLCNMLTAYPGGQSLYLERYQNAVSCVNKQIQIKTDYTLYGGTSEDSGSIFVSKFKEWVKKQKANGTPVILEYELAEPEIIPYTPAQQKAYDEIKNACTYKDTTHIFSTDEISPIYKTEHYLSCQSNNEEKINEIETLLTTTKTGAFLIENLEEDLTKEVE